MKMYTVKELRYTLAKFPDDMDVQLRDIQGEIVYGDIQIKEDIAQSGSERDPETDCPVCLITFNP